MRLDLNHHRSHGTRVFAGRDRGKSVRDAVDLDARDLEPGTVDVVVPQDTLYVSSSFFLGLFGKSVRTLGEDAFRAKYRFSGGDITSTLDAGVREALKTQLPF